MPSEPDSHTSPRAARYGTEAAEPVFCLSLLSLPEIGIVARVVQQLARLQLLPVSWHVADAGAHLVMDLQIAGLAQNEGELLAEAMRRLVGVEEVLTAGTMRRRAA